MKKIKNFGRLVKYEFVRLFRNKSLMIMLVLFAVSLLVVVSSISVNTKNLNIAIYTAGKSIDEISAMEIVEDKFDKDKFIFVSSPEEGIDKIKMGEVSFFIEVNSDTTPETLTMHYDAYSSSINGVILIFQNEKNAYSYESITDFLEKYGIKINNSYFESLSFKPINDVDKNKDLSLMTKFVVSVALGIGIVIMFGLAYSVARDNETTVHKTFSFMPINTHTFLWCKIVTYLIIGIIELLLFMTIGALLFDVSYATNFFIIFLLSLAFVLDTIVLGLVFSSFKGQIHVALCTMIVILIPLLLLTMGIIDGMFLPIQILLYLMPMTPFTLLFHGMVFGGVINWWYFGLLIAQTIAYYWIAYFLQKRNLRN